MPRRPCCCAFILLLASIATAGPNQGVVSTAQKKINLIQDHPNLGPRVISFSTPELIELGMKLLQSKVPGAITQPRLQLGTDAATATMLIDFSKLNRIASSPLSWLLGGPRMIYASVEFSSGNGTMRVHPTELHIQSLVLTGAALDFAIANLLLPYYPDAIVDRDFALPSTINRIKITPTAALVYRN
jgi:hypothetical protein